MIQKVKQPEIRNRLLISIALLLLILLSSLVFFTFKNRGEAINTGVSGHHKPTPPLPTFTIAASPTVKPLFFDTFIDNKKGWYTGSTNGYTRVVDSNMLILSDTNHSVLTESLPINDTFDDFSATITFSLAQAEAQDSLGIYVRGDSNLDHDYRIEVFGNDTYAISKESLDTTNKQQIVYMVGPTRSPLLKPRTQQNTFTIMMKGAKLVLLINGTVATSITDTDYKRGQIALFVSNSGNSQGVSAYFHSITVYPAPKQLP